MCQQKECSKEILLFCLTIHDLVSQLQSDFCLFYLDDGTTLGGDVDNLRHDFLLVDRVGAELSLVLNSSKSEIISENTENIESLRHSLPDPHVVNPSNAFLLGCPIGDLLAVSITL